MKKMYFFVLLISGIFILCQNPVRGQEGFESYNDGEIPEFLIEVNAGGNTAVEVTSEDKWEGNKSLVMRDDFQSTEGDPNFAVALNYTESELATFSFDVKVPDPLWFHIIIQDSLGRRGPDLVMYGLYGVMAENFFPGAIVTDEGANMAFPVGKWCNIELSMKVGSAYDQTCTLKITELEGDNPQTFTRNSFRFHLNPYTSNGDSIFNGSLENARVIFLADDNTSGRGNGNIYIDNLVYPQNSSSTGVADIKKNDFELFPNPSVGQATIKSSSPIEKIQIRNLEGKKVYQKVDAGLQHTCDLTNMPTGIYLVNIISGEKQVTQKLILNRN